MLLGEEIATLGAVCSSHVALTLTWTHRVGLRASHCAPRRRQLQYVEGRVDELVLDGNEGVHAEELLRLGEGDHATAEHGVVGDGGVEESEELGYGAEVEEVLLGVGGGGGEHAVNGLT